MSNPTTPREIADARLLSLFEGMYSEGKGGGDIYRLTARVVRTRKAHNCPGNFSGDAHPIPVGGRAVREHALVDGAWCTCWTCEKCIIAYAAEVGHELE